MPKEGLEPPTRRIVAAAVIIAASAVLALDGPIWLPGEAMASLIIRTITPSDGAALFDGVPLVSYWLTYEANSGGVRMGTFTGVGLGFGVVGLLAAVAVARPAQPLLRATTAALLVLFALMASAGFVFEHTGALVMAACFGGCAGIFVAVGR